MLAIIHVFTFSIALEISPLKEHTLYSHTLLATAQFLIIIFITFQPAVCSVAVKCDQVGDLMGVWTLVHPQGRWRFKWNLPDH